MTYHVDGAQSECLGRDHDVRACIQQLLAGSCANDTGVGAIWCVDMYSVGRRVRTCCLLTILSCKLGAESSALSTFEPRETTTATHQQGDKLPARGGTPARLPGRNLAQVVHRLRTLDTRNELDRRIIRAPEFVRAVGKVYLLGNMVQILRGMDLGKD